VNVRDAVDRIRRLDDVRGEPVVLRALGSGEGANGR
jgi:hypothetical protein